jgi:hypothetical protein
MVRSFLRARILNKTHKRFTWIQVAAPKTQLWNPPDGRSVESAAFLAGRRSGDFVATVKLCAVFGGAHNLHRHTTETLSCAQNTERYVSRSFCYFFFFFCNFPVYSMY